MRYVVLISVMVFMVLVLYLGVQSLNQATKFDDKKAPGNTPPASEFCMTDSRLQQDIARDYIAGRLTQESITRVDKENELLWTAAEDMLTCMEPLCPRLQDPEDVQRAMDGCLVQAMAQHGLEMSAPVSP